MNGKNGKKNENDTQRYRFWRGYVPVLRTRSLSRGEGIFDVHYKNYDEVLYNVEIAGVGSPHDLSDA